MPRSSTSTKANEGNWRSTMKVRARLRSTTLVLTLAAGPLLAQPGPDPAVQTQAAERPRLEDAAQGRTFKECRNCPEMIELPPGTFMMGSPLDDPMRRDNER